MAITAVHIILFAQLYRKFNFLKFPLSKWKTFLTSSGQTCPQMLLTKIRITWMTVC
jgi:hypothetical protein